MSLALRVTQPAPACSEQDLVAAVRRGNDRAFEELYARYRSRIGSYIFGMVGDHGRAEDIAQEVFISALRRLRETERTIIFKPWIYEIAKNACIDEFRRTRRIHEVPLEPESDHDFPTALPSTSPTPDAAVESKQRLTDLRGAFRGLSESHHRILVLRELEGLSYNQIGARLGMTKPVVESTLFRARRRLGEEFEELESGRRCERVQSLIASLGERPLRSLGVRERRQFARHVAHCELCLRQAREAGVDESLYRAPNLLGRMAVLAPIPWLRSLLPHLDPGGPGYGVGRAIATAAVVVAGAGAGGGIVLNLPRHPSRPSSAVVGAPSVVTAASSRSAVRVAKTEVRTGRYGVAGLVGATVRRGRGNQVSPVSTGSTQQLGIGASSLAPTQSRAQRPTVGVGSGGGSTASRRTVAGSPAGSGGSGDPGVAEPSQPGGAASQSTVQSGTPGGTAPSSGDPALSLGQTASGAVGVVNQGLSSLTPVTGPVPGGTGSTATPTSIPSQPAGGSGPAVATPVTGGTSSPSSPDSPSGSAAVGG